MKIEINETAQHHRKLEPGEIVVARFTLGSTRALWIHYDNIIYRLSERGLTHVSSADLKLFNVVPVEKISVEV